MSDIANDIRKYDYYRYLCCLLAPGSVRDHLITIYAFNNELAKIKYVITEPMAGYIRLQWWRDAIEEIYNGMPVKHNSPLVKALYDLICDTNIDKELFDNLIDAREADIEFDVPENIDALLNYMLGAYSGLFRILLAVCDCKDEVSSEVAEYAGVAYGLAHIMRSMRYNCYHGKIMFPKDLMTLASISAQEVLEGKNLKNTKDITKALCDRSINSLRHVRAMKRDLPKRALTALMPLSIVEPTIKRIRNNDYNLFDLDFDGSRFRLQYNILVSKVFNRV